MPTGYTSDIGEKNISFENFIMQCARAFGACIEMRDDPTDKPIPEEFKPSEYHSKQNQKYQKELEQVKSLSKKACQGQAEKEYQNQIKEHEEIIQEKKNLREKYDTMLKKVRAWIPPSDDHIELKKFMIEQINTSIDFDCNLKYYESSNLKCLTGP